MVKCRICRKRGVVSEFFISGHAGSGKRGSDIVCAAVTAIVYGAIGSLEEMFGIDDFEDVQGDEDVDRATASESNQENDYVRFCTPKEVFDDLASVRSIKIGAILDAMVIGLKQIEMQYQKYLEVTEREV